MEKSNVLQTKLLHFVHVDKYVPQTKYFKYSFTSFVNFFKHFLSNVLNFFIMTDVKMQIF